MTASSKVRWGVVSAAQIGLNHVIPAIQRSSNGRVVCIGTPHPERARERAEKLGVPRVYDSYAGVLDDPEVEAVYLPLPNSMHRDWTLRAAAAGKHVLCEKPMALTAAECREMIAACRRRGVLLICCVVTAVMFAVVKSVPAAALAFSRALAFVSARPARVLSDRTDLVALPATAVPMWISRRVGPAAACGRKR